MMYQLYALTFHAKCIAKSTPTNFGVMAPPFIVHHDA